MRLLFDFITPQSMVGGAGEYIRRVYFELLDFINKKRLTDSIEIIGVHDSSIGKYSYPDLTPEVLRSRIKNIVDCAGKKISEIVDENAIDTVFIGSSQYWGCKYDVQNIKVKVVTITHDICYEELASARMKEYLLLDTPIILFKELLHKKFKGNEALEYMKPVIELYNKNPNTYMVTVSNYSKNSIIYNFGIDDSRLKVFYSPEKIQVPAMKVSDNKLADLVTKGTKYYLLVGGNRKIKNANTALKAFKRYTELVDSNVFVVTTGIKEKQFANHIALPLLSDEDLCYAYQHCYALIYPTFFEGFGYPPIEAMKYSKPVLLSNTTSLPEIYGECAIFFSPLFESDIFYSIVKLEENYEEYQQKCTLSYKVINKHQENDLQKLIQLIIN